MTVPMSPNKLVSQPTDRTSRKVSAASGGAAAGSIVGFFLANWTYDLILPESMQAVDGSAAAWGAIIIGLCAYISSLQLGRYFRERLENMLLERPE